MRPYNSESGNVIILIFIGIILFSALSYAVTRSTRFGGERGNVDKTKLDIAVTDVLSYANSVSTAVQALKAAGCSDTQISFENSSGTSKQANGVAYTYVNAGAPSDKSCHVFDVNGGGVTPRLLQKEGMVDPATVTATHLHAYSWRVSSGRILGVGTDAATDSGSDLLLLLGKPTQEFCIAINKALGITNPGGIPPYDTTDTSAPFDGIYVASGNPVGEDATSLKGKKTFCMQNTSAPAYLIIHVLLAR